MLEIFECSEWARSDGPRERCNSFVALPRSRSCVARITYYNLALPVQGSVRKDVRMERREQSQPSVLYLLGLLLVAIVIDVIGASSLVLPGIGEVT